MVCPVGVEELVLRLGVGGTEGELPGLPGVTSLPAPGAAVVLLADTVAGASWARQRRDVLSAEESVRAERFVVPGLGETWAAAHVLVREVLGRVTLTPPADVSIRQGIHGKPLVDGVEFSLSHTGTLVLIGVGRLPLGVDVEAIPAGSTASLAGSCLHPGENAELLALGAAQRREAFTRAWVRKEAMLKAIGTGLLRDPASDYVGTGPMPHNPIEGLEIHDLDLPGMPGHRAAICVSTTPPPHR